MRQRKIKNRVQHPQKVADMRFEELPQTAVGVLQRGPRGAVVVTDHRQIKTDIIVSSSRIGMADYGDKVIVRLLKWRRNSSLPEGEVIDILGAAGENETEMHAILAEYGLPYGYPDELSEEADKIDAGITEKEVLRRYDMREVPTFTIDPEDAKDFDDALSFRQTDNGYEVGVHIADVTHYVKSGTALDDEAYSRATSVYLVDRTIPMLPEHLCNEICSLRPDEDKLTFSVIFLLNDKAEVQKSSIKRTIIRSNRRFSYEEAQRCIETGEGDFAQELQILNRLAIELRTRRFQHGSIAFERDEIKFHLDEKGVPTGVYFKEMNESNHLIEEFMLLANRTIAEFIGKNTKQGQAPTFVYRVHDLPDTEKMQDLTQFIKKFGYTLKLKENKQPTAKGINGLLKKVQGKAEQNLIETLTLRTMAKAVYSTDNIGHYGLAFPYYTHFTSPIRRYPDMMVHRLIEKYMKGGASVPKAEWEEKCKHCSDREQLAANAERASIKYKQVEFMQDKIGQTFDGVIAGVTEFGLFVELKDNKCEGFIPIRELDDNDYFDFSEKEYCLYGRITGKKYQMGDELRVVVERADLMKKQLDFRLA